MKKLVFLLLLVNTAAYATCSIERITCSPDAIVQNQYEIERVSCVAPGGPVNTTETFYVRSYLDSSCISPRRNCFRDVVNRRLNYTRHDYFQAELRMDRSGNYLRIDDRRNLMAGELHLSTPAAGYIRLFDYKCFRSYQ